MPYYNRSDQLYNTFVSFKHHYSNRSDYEIILIEDTKNDDDLHEVVNLFNNFFSIYIFSGDDKPNPSTAFNMAAEKATGEFLIITNPECFHLTNILKTLDSINLQFYIVCACQHIKRIKRINSMAELKYEPIKWYQHSIKNPRQFHFCSAINRSSYLKIGGFDERFSKGVAYDDAVFLNNILKNNIKVIQKDNAVVLHQNQ